jgi:hypothetical protein
MGVGDAVPAIALFLLGLGAMNRLSNVSHQRPMFCALFRRTGRRVGCIRSSLYRAGKETLLGLFEERELNVAQLCNEGKPPYDQR